MSLIDQQAIGDTSFLQRCVFGGRYCLRMDYEEIEELKRLAFSSEITAPTLQALIICIAHWIRQSNAPAWSVYAANWMRSQHGRRDSFFGLVQYELLFDRFPLVGEQLLFSGQSDWPAPDRTGGAQLAPNQRTVLLKKPEVAKRTGMSVSWINAAFPLGKFPKPIHIGRQVFWPEHWVEDWIRSQIDLKC